MSSSSSYLEVIVFQYSIFLLATTKNLLVYDTFL